MIVRYSLIAREIDEINREHRDADEQAAKAELEDHYVRQATQVPPLPRGGRLVRLRPERTVEPGGQRAEVVLDGVVQRADHLHDRVLTGGCRAHAGLIGEVKLDRLHRDAVVTLAARWVAEDHLQQQFQRVQFRGERNRQTVRPVPIVSAIWNLR